MFKELKIAFEMWRKQRLQYQFVTILSSSINLEMIELARGKKINSFIKTKQYKEKIEEKVNFLISHFTYKEWIIILSTSNSYQKESTNKEEDIKINLDKFLTKHYKELYQIFDMNLYDSYQWKEKEEMDKLLLAEEVSIDEKITNAVIFYYKDGSRMCYSPETGKRTVVENILLTNKSVIVSLVEKKPTKLDKWKKLLFNLFMEEE